MSKHYVVSWWIYGIIVIASGGYRYYSQPDGHKALYFGLVTGALAMAAGLLLCAGKTIVAHVAGFLSVAFVAGWFLFESLVKDGGSREPRLLIVAAISLLQAALAVKTLRSGTPAEAE